MTDNAKKNETHYIMRTVWRSEFQYGEKSLNYIRDKWIVASQEQYKGDNPSGGSQEFDNRGDALKAYKAIRPPVSGMEFDPFAGGFPSIEEYEECYGVKLPE